MANLFIINDKVVNPTTEILLLEPFKTIWNRDKDKDKHTAREEFAYIEFMSSAKKSNPFRGYDEEQRDLEIKKKVITNSKWKPDKLVLEGIQHWNTYQKEASANYSLWMSAKMAGEKLGRFLRNIDPNERDEKGKPVYKPRDITSALTDISKVITNMNALEKKVEEELYEETRNKADKTISRFADPNSLQ